MVWEIEIPQIRRLAKVFKSNNLLIKGINDISFKNQVVEKYTMTIAGNRFRKFINKLNESVDIEKILMDDEGTLAYLIYRQLTKEHNFIFDKLRNEIEISFHKVI